MRLCLGSGHARKSARSSGGDSGLWGGLAWGGVAQDGGIEAGDGQGLDDCGGAFIFSMPDPR